MNWISRGCGASGEGEVGVLGCDAGAFDGEGCDGAACEAEGAAPDFVEWGAELGRASAFSGSGDVVSVDVAAAEGCAWDATLIEGSRSDGVAQVMVASPAQASSQRREPARRGCKDVSRAAT